MDDRDEWLEGVRRWYFGGDAPAEALEVDEPAWPGRETAQGFATCAMPAVASQPQAMSAAASSA